MAPGLPCFWDTKDWLTCTLDLLTYQIGEPIFALLIGGFVMASFWLAGGRNMAVPSVIIIGAGGFLIPTLPGQYTAVGTSLVVIGIAAAVMSVGKRYVLNPAA